MKTAIETYYKDLLCYARRFSGQMESSEPEDVVHDFVLHFQKSNLDASKYTNVKTYLLKSLHHFFIDLKRKKKALKIVLSLDIELVSNHSIHFTTEQLAAKDELIQLLLKKIAQLEQKERYCLWLFYWQKNTCREISLKTGLTTQQVKDLLKKSRKFLCKEIKKVKQILRDGKLVSTSLVRQFRYKLDAHQL